AAAARGDQASFGLSPPEEKAPALRLVLAVDLDRVVGARAAQFLAPVGIAVIRARARVDQKIIAEADEKRERVGVAVRGERAKPQGTCVEEGAQGGASGFAFDHGVAAFGEGAHAGVRTEHMRCRGLGRRTLWRRESEPARARMAAGAQARLLEPPTHALERRRRALFELLAEREHASLVVVPYRKGSSLGTAYRVEELRGIGEHFHALAREALPARAREQADEEREVEHEALIRECLLAAH